MPLFVSNLNWWLWGLRYIIKSRRPCDLIWVSVISLFYLTHHGRSQGRLFWSRCSIWQYKKFFHISAPSSKSWKRHHVRSVFISKLQVLLLIMVVALDVEDTTITLRALNDLKSSFASIEFTNMFFEHFLVSETYKSFSCRLAIKVSVLHIHRPWVYALMFAFAPAHLCNFPKYQECPNHPSDCKYGWCWSRVSISNGVIERNNTNASLQVQWLWDYERAFWRGRLQLCARQTTGVCTDPRPSTPISRGRDRGHCSFI